MFLRAAQKHWRRAIGSEHTSHSVAGLSGVPALAARPARPFAFGFANAPLALPLALPRSLCEGASSSESPSTAS
eukprot:3004027-Alexandrium_andersonii.AAC.1